MFNIYVRKNKKKSKVVKKAEIDLNNYTSNNKKLIVSNKNIINSPSGGSSDEYQGLTYKTVKQPLIKCVDLTEPLDKNEKTEVTVPTKKKSSADNDYRIKYKTEKCKFWELNKECKFGDNVNNFF